MPTTNQDQNTSTISPPSLNLPQGCTVREMEPISHPANDSDDKIASNAMALQLAREHKRACDASVTNSTLAEAEKYHFRTLSNCTASSPSSLEDRIERMENNIISRLDVQEQRNIFRLRNSKASLEEYSIIMLVDSNGNSPNQHRMTVQELNDMNSANLETWLNFYSLPVPHYVQEKRIALKNFLGCPQ
eukprot:gb/GECH01008429.1/.p1 GENE.gb/GECH01008429.1/~~gb/GECH01008429.1/.p1  ORF type:complete len:189 (+),score=21.45 gb/GECH01008429.1/:1-567(+)